MNLHRKLAAIAAAAMTTLLLATPASAQATRTWVSGVGDDANPCSRTAPCKTFAGAIAKTATAGEIDCLDPGGFGALTITKAITIDCSAPGHIGGVLVAGTNGFVVNVPTGTVVQLFNLDIDGLAPNAGAGLNGVVVLGGTVLISNSHIYGFTGGTCNGISGGSGVCVNGPLSTKVVINDTIISTNTNGVVNSPSAGTNQVVIAHSLLTANTTVNVQNAGAGAKTFLDADILVNCPAATINTAGAMSTYGNNVMTGTVSTLTPAALQ